MTVVSRRFHQGKFSASTAEPAAPRPYPMRRERVVQAVVSPLSRPIGPPFTDIPLPIESYATFTALFDPGGSPEQFRHRLPGRGGALVLCARRRRCYVVRMGDPVSPDDDAERHTGKAAQAGRIAAR